jgi:hypothetical protein
LADRLLKVGRLSEPAASGEGLGDGATTSGVVLGESEGAGGATVGVVSDDDAVGVVSGIAAGVGVGVASGVAAGVGVGVASGIALGVVSRVGAGVGVGVASGVALGVVSGVAAGVGVGVARGDAFSAGVDVDVAAGVGDGELAGCPPGGVAGCCSHPATRRLARATATTRQLFIPKITDARASRIFKVRCKGLEIQAFRTIEGALASFLTGQIGLAENSEAFTGQDGPAALLVIQVQCHGRSTVWPD